VALSPRDGAITQRNQSAINCFRATAYFSFTMLRPGGRRTRREPMMLSGSRRIGGGVIGKD
jgi:hypothetical protein